MTLSTISHILYIVVCILYFLLSLHRPSTFLFIIIHVFIRWQGKVSSPAQTAFQSYHPIRDAYLLETKILVKIPQGAIRIGSTGGRR